MIAYEIKRVKDKPNESPPEGGSSGGGLLFERYANRGSRPVNLVNQPTTKEVPDLPPLGMGKLQYAKWLNSWVYPRFSKGTLVTLSRFPFVIDELPEVVFEVSEIAEMHYDVNWDRHTRQPRAVGVRNLKHTGSSTAIYYPPAVLRPLHQQEVDLVDSLRNQEGAGRDRQVEGSGSTDNDDDGPNYQMA